VGSQLAAVDTTKEAAICFCNYDKMSAFTVHHRRATQRAVFDRPSRQQVLPAKK
jgi:hypothetical protein